jgi:hypothetical protein
MTYLSQYTSQQRWWITVGGLVLLALASYFLSIRKTLLLRSELTEKSIQLQNIDDAPQVIAQLEQQLQVNDQQFLQGPYNRNNLFAKVSTFCAEHHLNLLEFGEDQRWQQDQLNFITSPIRVAGTYHDILRLMYYLEHQEHLGYLVHCDLALVEKSRRSRQKELQAELHLQNIEIEN